ncbi:hypothetical protein [Taibaiella soli]|uniref:Uncharacterized protein n=1 Tax=Taibaiella soli TaxID=1649169 RepID=A0A2W2B2T2_9BACT|nr:hypothetical protein [Taibaiella soli]PZF74594.1 hypothetical protein DN068_03180 [Taibaiella soli]
MGEIPQLIPKMNDGGVSFGRLPLPLKILIIASMVIPVIWTAVIMPIKESRNQEDFYAQKCNSVVVSSSDDGRFTAYKMRNGLWIKFYSSARNQLAVGDSIEKTFQTFLYKAYRKDIMEEYQFLGDFDFTVFK